MYHFGKYINMEGKGLCSDSSKKLVEFESKEQALHFLEEYHIVLTCNSYIRYTIGTFIVDEVCGKESILEYLSTKDDFEKLTEEFIYAR